jgi:hypothetical protein
MYPDHDNGILERIRGEDIAAAIQTLPPAELSKVDTIEVDHDVPGIGRVRFTARRKRAKHHRHSHYFWSAAKAVVVE